MSRFTSIRSRSHKLHICSFFLLLVFLAGLSGGSAFAIRICMGDETNPLAGPSVVVQTSFCMSFLFLVFFTLVFFTLVFFTLFFELYRS